MKKYLCILSTVISIILLSVISGQAERYHGGGGGGHGGGHGWGPVLGLGLGLGLWELSHPYYYHPYSGYYSGQPVIIEQQPQEVLIQPVPQYAPAPPPPEPYYWYFCKEPQGYYPYVKQCPQGWMKVVPTPPEAPASPYPASK